MNSVTDAAPPYDAKTAAAVAAIRTRLADHGRAMLEDFDALHQMVDAARPLTHTVEAFEALETLDMQTWEFREGLRTLLARAGLLPDAG